MRIQTDRDGFYDQRDELCGLCIFRAVAAFREASEASVPLDIIADGFCRKCECWLSLQAGSLADGTLTIRLVTGDGLLDIQRSR